MSAVRNHNWYTLNGTRRWPLDDAATGEDDRGRSLRNDVLVDAALRAPADLCALAAVSSVTVTRTLVSVTLVGVQTPPVRPAGDASAGPEAFVPLGAVSVRQPVVPGRPYPVNPMSPGVGGWVVFGEGVERDLQARFSTPAQGLLAPKACRTYRRLPVESAGKLGAALALTGVVLLKGGTDVEVVAGDRVIAGRLVPAVVVRLRGNTPRNLLQQYAGPCAGRPESNTCNRPAVEFLNTVGPDCDGDVRVEFPSPLRATYYAGGVALDYPFGLIDACTRDDRLPAADGRLPNEYADECNPTSAGDPDAPAVPPAPLLPSLGQVSSEVASVSPGVLLPFTAWFDGGAAPGFYAAAGTWEVTAVDSPNEPVYSSSVGSIGFMTETQGPAGALTATDPVGRSVSAWYAGGSAGASGVRLSADVQLDGGLGVAGLVANYRVNAAGTGQEYWTVEVSRPGVSLRLRRWNGTSWATLAEAPLAAVVDGVWYNLTLAVETVGPAYRLTAEARNEALALLGTATVDTVEYGPPDGLLGVGTDRTRAAFSYLRVEAYP